MAYASVPISGLERLIARLAHLVPEPEIALSYPLLERIATLKDELGAIVVAHNYQVPLITAGVADFTGDSLEMARFAARCDAEVIVVCGVHFMAESVKLLCPGKRVLLPSPDAGCSLAGSITAAGVRDLRRRHPGISVVAYVNTSAAVKAEADICCTSANAVEVALSLREPRLIMLPDRHLARYAGTDIADYRASTGAVVLAHPECPQDVQEQADFVGSTSAMARYLGERRPERVLLLTECSMADTVSVVYPDIQFLRPCNLCGYMKTVTLERIADALQALRHEVTIDEAVAVRARRSLERMLAL
jgi:quinolinate synthase